MKAKKLIEVAMPIKEISAESVRDKSIRHGHISTLHLWWARRPLPACRAIVFASLVPDPLDENCPQAFKDAVATLLNSSVYAPYPDIPYTSIYDPMEDNLRHRLMMFVGKFSDKCQRNMLAGKTTAPAEQLDANCLIKWENKNDERVLGIARKLIWVAYHSDKDGSLSFEKMSRDFDKAYQAIKEAEKTLYAIPDRHVETAAVKEAEEALHHAIEAFQNEMPSVFDPFAGGGAIPLEAARLGCRSYGNDINPVAHIIEKGSAEFPQKYGKPITYSAEEFLKLYGDEGVRMLQEKGISWPSADGLVRLPNRLAWDVEFYAKQILCKTEKEIGEFYPNDNLGRKPVAYYWARTATCSNPSCGAKVPMFTNLNLVNSSRRNYYLNPIIDGKSVSFNVKSGKCSLAPWNYRGNLTCPCCGNITNVDSIKEQFLQGKIEDRLIVVVYDTLNGKEYALPTDEQILKTSQKVDPIFKPKEFITKNSGGGDTLSWGYTRWGDLYTDRQLRMINTFISNFRALLPKFENGDYNKALIVFLTMWIDRIILFNNSFGRWEHKSEAVKHPYSRQAISIKFEYPEANPFSDGASGGVAMLEWTLRYLNSESNSSFSAFFVNSSSGEESQFAAKELTAVITDPPYYDAIAYADCSDFFYVWLKRIIGDVFPSNFTTPQTPKQEECTAMKHHHNNDDEEAKKHFERKLTQILDAIEKQTSDMVSIMFAHQSTEAWTTLCNSILEARMNITGSWPMDTEMSNRVVGLSGAALESSVTVACRPSQRVGYGEYKEVEKAIKQNVKEEVEKLYALGFRGADLLTACFGQAVSEFGKYKVVEKANGDTVTVGELLDLARDTAFNALIEGVQGDDFTKFYLGWLQLNGMGETEFDDVTKFTRVGLPINIQEVFAHNLLIKEESGNKQHLATAAEHLGEEHITGWRKDDLLIEQAHRAILLYKDENRNGLLKLLHDIEAQDVNAPFWRLLASLKELLPANDDLKQVQGLLQNGEDLRRASKLNEKPQEVQGTLEL